MPRRTVLLLNTNRIKPPIAPIALDYIGAALRAEGHEVRLLDLCWEDDVAVATARAFADGRPDLVAMTFRNTDDCYFASGRAFVDILRDDVALIRRHYDGPIAVGGGGFSTMPIPLLEYCGADYGVCGDGEPAIVALLRALDEAMPRRDVPGLVHREGGQWRANAPYFADCGLHIVPPRDIVDNRRYFVEGGQAGIETKRGCTSGCIYCADPVIKGRTARWRPPDHVVHEMQNLLAQGIDTYHFCDSEFNLPPDHAEAVCRAIIASGLGSRIHWYTYASPTAFTTELAGLMQRAGCLGVNFGVDSGSDRMLAALGRSFTRKSVVETALICRSVGLVFMYDLLLGGPGETPATVAETVRLMMDINPDRVGVSLGVRIYPGTPLAARVASLAFDPSSIVGDPTTIAPAFFMSPELGPQPMALLRDLIGKDERFFLASGGDQQDYNYNDNAVLQRAITAGHRGAYWGILRKLQMDPPP
jgi:tryptophan 2-C-methyltransferase